MLLIDNILSYFNLNYHLQNEVNTLDLGFTLGLDSTSDLDSTLNFTLRECSKLNLIFFFKFKSKLQKLIKLVLFLKEIKFQD